MSTRELSISSIGIVAALLARACDGPRSPGAAIETQSSRCWHRTIPRTRFLALRLELRSHDAPSLQRPERGRHHRVQCWQLPRATHQNAAFASGTVHLEILADLD